MKPLLFTAALLAMGFAAACSSSARVASSSGGDAGPLSSPPPPGPPHPPDGTLPRTFAITRLFLGDTDPDGTPDPANGWRHFGYNIDGLSPGDPSAFCKLTAGAPATVREQGDHGIESSFGHDYLPYLLGVSVDYGALVNQALAGGSRTTLITIDALGAGPSYDPLPGAFHAGAALGAPPKLEGTDVWPTVQGSAVPFSTSYLTANTWVSGPPIDTATVDLVLGPFEVHLRHAVVSMNLDAAHEHATGGTISGVLQTSEAQSELMAILKAYQGTLCLPPNLEPFIVALGQASDILQDGTQDPGQTCDGISVGLGFEAALVTLGGDVPPPVPPPVCPE